MKNFRTFIRYDLPVLARMFMPTFFILAVSVHFSEFIHSAIMANKAINCAIIFAALYGVVLIYLRLFCLQRDMAGLDRFSREALSGQEMKGLLEQPWLKGRAICHYLEHIAHTEGTLASQLDQDAIQNELEALSEEYNSKMEMPQFLVGFMVAMGLLGTFIGLLETLTGISGMLDGLGGGGNIEEEFGKLVVELRKPLAGMGIAFSASMFGLVTSLQLAVMMIMLRRYTSRVTEKARSVMHRLLTRIKSRIQPEYNAAETRQLALAPMGRGGTYLTGIEPSFEGDAVEGRRASPLGRRDDAFENEIQDDDSFAARDGGTLPSGPRDSRVRDEISDAYFRTQDSLASVGNSIALLVKRIETLSRSLDGSLAETQRTNNLLNFGPRMTEANEQMLREVRVLVASQEDSQKVMQKIISSLIQIDQSLMASNPKDLISSQRETITVLNDLFGNAQTQTRLSSEVLEVQRENNREMIQALRALQQSVQKQEEIGIGFSKHVWDIKENFSRATTSFSLVDSVAENIEKQTRLIEASLTEDRSTQRSMVNSIQRELRDFTDTLRQHLNVTAV